MMQTNPVQPQSQAAPVQPMFQARVYKTATPLNVLGRTGAPADCPACGQRSMTRIVSVVGNTNQSVTLFPLPISVFVFLARDVYMRYVRDIADVLIACGLAQFSCLREYVALSPILWIQ